MIMLVGACWGLLLGLKDEYDEALEAKLRAKNLMRMWIMKIDVQLYLKLDLKVFYLVLRQKKYLQSSYCWFLHVC